MSRGPTVCFTYKLLMCISDWRRLFWWVDPMFVINTPCQNYTDVCESVIQTTRHGRRAVSLCGVWYSSPSVACRFLALAKISYYIKWKIAPQLDSCIRKYAITAQTRFEVTCQVFSSLEDSDCIAGFASGEADQRLVLLRYRPVKLKRANRFLEVCVDQSTIYFND